MYDKQIASNWWAKTITDYDQKVENRIKPWMKSDLS